MDILTKETMSHDQFLGWLEDTLQYSFNDEGCFVVPTEVDANDILDAYRDWDTLKFSGTLTSYFNNVFAESDTYYFSAIDNFENELDAELTWKLSEDTRTGIRIGDSAVISVEDMEEYISEWRSSDTFWDDLESAGFGGVYFDTSDSLSQDFKVNILLASEKELNKDLSSITRAFGESGDIPNLKEVNTSALDNALSYLVNQQGYSVADVYNTLITDKSTSTFIDSVTDEIENNIGGQSQLCCLVRMDGSQLMDFFEQLEISKNSFRLPMDSCIIGLFDQMGGSGSLLGIQPEKDVVLPFALIHNFQIEGATQGYTVDDTFGLIDSCWKEMKPYPGVESHVKEDYKTVLDKAVAIQKEHEQKSSRDLNTLAFEKREVSTQLSDKGVTPNIKGVERL